LKGECCFTEIQPLIYFDEPSTLFCAYLQYLLILDGLYSEHLEATLYSYFAYVIFLWVQFLEVSPELGNSYNEVIAPQDVATYGGLCALASFDRTELKVFLLLHHHLLLLLHSLFLLVNLVLHWLFNELQRVVSNQCFCLAEQSHRQSQLP